MVKSYIPEKGDIVEVNFDPQRGREQAGKRPAVIISPKIYNAKTGLAIMCPITSQKKGYPFEVDLSETQNCKGVILADHVKNLDWKCRHAKLIEKISVSALQETLAKLNTLLNLRF